MKIMIIRHAEPDYSIDSLTAKGRREAEMLSRRLVKTAREEHVSGVYVSPCGRAMDTASYVLKQTGLHAEVLPWLTEFRGVCLDPDRGYVKNCWDFRPRTWLGRPLLYDPEHFYEDPLLQGGNVKEIWDETTQGVDRILADHGYTRDGGIWTCANNRDDVLMLFCHFGIGMAVAAYLTSTSPFLLWHTTSMAPSSVTTLITEERVKGEVWFRCVQMGDISHLWAENEPYSTAGLFAEVYDGRDSTEPASWGSRA